MCLILLTAQPGFEAAAGAVRRFWQAQRHAFGFLTYFSFLELTREGEPHYHAILVNPPLGFGEGAHKAELERQWGRYVKLKWRDSSWFARSAGGYVGSYAKKMGDKAFQQDYEDVPVWLRTFECQRLDHSAAELRAHESSWEGAYRGVQWDFDLQSLAPPRLELLSHRVHEHAASGLRRVTKEEWIAKRKRLTSWVWAGWSLSQARSAVGSSKEQLGAIGRSESAAVEGLGSPAEVEEIPPLTQLALPGLAVVQTFHPPSGATENPRSLNVPPTRAWGSRRKSGAVSPAS